MKVRIWRLQASDSDLLKVGPRTGRIKKNNGRRPITTDNIVIQKPQKELPETFMMISNWKKPMVCVFFFFKC